MDKQDFESYLEWVLQNQEERVETLQRLEKENQEQKFLGNYQLYFIQLKKFSEAIEILTEDKEEAPYYSIQLKETITFWYAYKNILERHVLRRRGEIVKEDLWEIKIVLLGLERHRKETLDRLARRVYKLRQGKETEVVALALSKLGEENFHLDCAAYSEEVGLAQIKEKARRYKKAKGDLERILKKFEEKEKQKRGKENRRINREKAEQELREYQNEYYEITESWLEQKEQREE